MGASKTRLRKVACPDCGYTVRMARSWMERGLPVCPCGQAMEPESPADRAFIGMIGQDDVPAPMWTAICGENRWDDCIVRKGNAYKQYLASGSARLESRRTARADHCAYPGCPRWVANGADRCAAGHAQHDDMPAVEATPF
jgi:hypothetical protein